MGRDPAAGGIHGLQDRYFLEKIGKEVSKSVRKELLERFTPMNKSILDKIFEQVVDGEEKVNALVEGKEFKSILTDLAKKV